MMKNIQSSDGMNEISTPSKVCMVCRDKALGYNFNAVTCESCKAFFRRNALTTKPLTCPFSEQCEITVVTRRFCQKCRLEKCFSIGMKKEYIMSEEDKIMKRKKIEQNRAKKKQSNSNRSSSNENINSPPPVKIKREPSDDDVWTSRRGPQSSTSVTSFDVPSPNSSSMSFGSPNDAIPSSFMDNSTSSSIEQYYRPSDAAYQSPISEISPTSCNGSMIKSPELPPLTITIDSPPSEIVSCFVDSPAGASRVIGHLMKTPDDAINVMGKILNSPKDAIQLISHFISAPGDALKIISKIMNSPFDALTVFTKFMSSPTDAFEIITKIISSPNDVVQFLQQLMKSPEDGLQIMTKFINAPAEALRIINKMMNHPKVDSTTSPNVMDNSPLPFDNLDNQQSQLKAMLGMIQFGDSPNSSTSITSPHESVTETSSSCETTSASHNIPSSYQQYNNENDIVRSSIPDVTKNILEDIEREPIQPNSIESVLCEAIKLEYEAYNSIAQSNSNNRELNDAERAKLNELIVANKALYAPVDEDLSSLIYEDCRIKSNTNQQDPQLLKVINLTAVAIRRLIKMSKKISAFKNMCQEDQVALLKGGCTEMMILRSVMQYDSDRASWKIPHIKEAMSNIRADVLKLAKGNVYEEHERFILTFDPKWRTDENIILIMSAITLFTPDRVRTIHSDVIKLEQNSYYYLLRRYLESVYPGCEAKSTFLKLIQKVNELRKLNDVVIGVYLDVNPSQVEPLLRELFDLKNH